MRLVSRHLPVPVRHAPNPSCGIPMVPGLFSAYPHPDSTKTSLTRSMPSRAAASRTPPKRTSGLAPPNRDGGGPFSKTASSPGDFATFEVSCPAEQASWTLNPRKGVRFGRINQSQKSSPPLAAWLSVRWSLGETLSVAKMTPSPRRATDGRVAMHRGQNNYTMHPVLFPETCSSRAAYQV